MTMFSAFRVSADLEWFADPVQTLMLSAMTTLLCIKSCFLSVLIVMPAECNFGALLCSGASWLGVTIIRTGIPRW